MFINAMPASYARKNGVLVLPSWIRAPLAMSAGQVAYFFQNNVAESEAESSAVLPETSTELVFTTIPPTLWGDLWRLELQIRDEPGLMRRLIEIIDQYKIFIVAEESRNAFIPTYHVKSLILDCRRYSSDLDPQEFDGRVGIRKDLFGLKARIFLEFAESIRFSDAGRPRMTLERIFAMQNLAKAMDQDEGDLSLEAKRQLEPLRKLGVDETEIGYDVGRVGVDLSTPPPAIISHPSAPQSASFRPIDVSRAQYVALSVNARAKIGYCRLVWPDGVKHYIHFIFYVTRRQISLKFICEIIEECNLNILRSQLSPGVLGRSFVGKLQKSGEYEPKGDDVVEVVDEILARYEAGGDEDAVFTVNVFAEQPRNKEAEELAAVARRVSARIADRVPFDGAPAFAMIAYRAEGIRAVYDGSDLAQDGGAADGRDADQGAAEAETRPAIEEGQGQFRPRHRASRKGYHRSGKASVKPLNIYTDLRDLALEKAKRLRRLRQSEAAFSVSDERMREISLQEREVWRVRRALVERIGPDAVDNRNEELNAPKVFLSFSFETPFASGFEDAAQQAAKRLGVSVVTGRFNGGGGPSDPRVLDNIRKKIAASDMLLTLFTPADANHGLWLHMEVGMAIAGDLPFAVVAHQGIDGARWRQHLDHRYNCSASDELPLESNLRTLVTNALQRLVDEYLRRGPPGHSGVEEDSDPLDP